MKKPKKVYPVVSVDVATGACPVGTPISYEAGDYYRIIEAPEGWERQADGSYRWECDGVPRMWVFKLREMPYADA